MKTFEVKTQGREELVDITDKVSEVVRSAQVKDGACVVYVPHTTAAVTINENADPSVKHDILMTLEKIVPDSLPYSHSEGNSPAHVKACLLGSSVNIIIQGGKLTLGTWQGIFFCEFDGPRTRKVLVKVSASE